MFNILLSMIMGAIGMLLLSFAAIMFFAIFVYIISLKDYFGGEK